jgi:hypothetical protein
MNTIGNVSLLPVLPVTPRVSDPVPDGASVLPDALSGGTPQQDKVSLQSVEQQPAPVQHIAQQIANTRILGNTTFVTFRDAGGQDVTRIRDRDTGKVIYLPREPELTKVNIRV